MHPRAGVFQRLAHYFRGPNPLHPSLWEGRLKPVTFRRFTPSDLPQCLELYRLNEAGRFPEGVIGKYEDSLAAQKSYFLVAEAEGQVVASGGMHYLENQWIAVFCYGLVRPGFQGRGLGTALLLARLSLLNAESPAVCVFIFAIAKSIDFYGRFGFRTFKPWRDTNGHRHPSGKLFVSADEIRQCRQLLANHGIVVPDDQDKIPLLTHDQVK